MLGGEGGLVVDVADVLGEGGDEHRHVPVAFDATEAAFGVEHPGSAPGSTMVPSRQRLTLRWVVRATEIIDSTGLVDPRVRHSRSESPRRRTVNISSRPSRSDAAAPGCLASSALARSRAARSPASASGSLNALASLASTKDRSRSGRCR